MYVHLHVNTVNSREIGKKNPRAKGEPRSSAGLLYSVGYVHSTQATDYTFL